MKKVFLMLTIVAFSSVVVNAQSHVGHHATTTQKAKTSSTHAMLGVQGNCDMCKARIEKAALGVKGVSSAMWEAKDQKLVSYRPTPSINLHQSFLSLSQNKDHGILDIRLFQNPLQRIHRFGR